MKNLSRIIVVTLVTLSSVAVYAGPTFSNPDRTLQQKMDCYREHHKVMDKPSLQTLDACWKAHHQLMK